MANSIPSKETLASLANSLVLGSVNLDTLSFVMKGDVIQDQEYHRWQVHLLLHKDSPDKLARIELCRYFYNSFERVYVPGAALWE